MGFAARYRKQPEEDFSKPCAVRHRTRGGFPTPPAQKTRKIPLNVSIFRLHFAGKNGIINVQGVMEQSA